MVPEYSRRAMAKIRSHFVIIYFKGAQFMKSPNLKP
jgi:hypothetical protein